MTVPFSPRTEKIILGDFEKFRARIEPTNQQKSSISTSHIKMRSLLENTEEIHVIETFLTGSYERQTMIKPIKDVDFFVQVHHGAHKHDNSIQLLRKVYKVLKKAYPQTPIKITPPCVTVRFNYCHFEVVPAFAIKNKDGLYEIPAEKKIGWQPTYPKIPDKWMTQENKKARGLFIPTIKMLKRWRDIHCSPLRSFHLEILTGMAFESYKIENYARGTWAFFKRTMDLLELNQRKPFIKEPGKENIYVDQYLYNERVKLEFVKRKVNIAYSYAQRAFDHMGKNQIGTAKRLWKRIFGDEFPAPITTNIPLSRSPFEPKPPPFFPWRI